MKSVILSLVILLSGSMPLCGQDGSDIANWVHTVVETSLDYHCRAKFGDNEKTFTSNPDKLIEKWERLERTLDQAASLRSPPGWVDSKTQQDLNTAIIGYFRKLRQWELWLRASKQDFHAKMDYFLMRVTLESLGGDDAKMLYDAMPDDLEAKQDLSSVVSAGINRELQNGSMQHALEIGRLELIDSLNALDDPNARAIANDLMRLAQKAEFEQHWLKENRPGLLEREFIAARKELFALHEAVSSRMSSQKLEKIKACPSNLCRQFMADYQLASKYEEQSTPSLAIAPTKRWQAILDSAYKESLDWSARKSGGSSSLPSQLMELLMTTTDVYQPRSSSGDQPFDYVNPIDIETIQEQAKTIGASGEDYGFVGVIDAVEKVVGLAVTNDDTLVVLGQTGVATYDLATGTRKHLLYDLSPDIKLTSMRVTQDGKHAYVVSDQPSLIRYDLASGQNDESFRSPEIQREDAKLAVSPDGRMLAVGEFGKVHLYDSKSGELAGWFRSQLNLLIYGLEFSSNSRSLLVYGNGPNHYEYDLRNGKLKRERRIVPDKRNAYVYSLRESNGMLAAGGVGAIAAWPENSTKPTFQASISGGRSYGSPRWASVAPDRKHLICSHGLWDMESGDVRVRFVPRWNTAAMALTKDASRLVIGADKTVFIVPSCLEPVSTDEPQSWETRIWTDKTGKFTLNAVFVKLDNGQVTLAKPDGSQLQVATSVLSDADQRYLADVEKEYQRD